MVYESKEKWLDSYQKYFFSKLTSWDFFGTREDNVAIVIEAKMSILTSLVVFDANTTTLINLVLDAGV